MVERIFLEDVGNPYSINALGNAKAWKVRHLRNDPAIPPLIYVMESEVGQQLLLGREISGRPKFNMIRYLAKLFIELFFEQLKEKDCSQYIILRGAYPFDLQYAIGCTPPYDLLLLPTGFIKLQRVLNQQGTDWEIQSQNLIGEYQGDIWLIPDTVIASGSTITSSVPGNSDVLHWRYRGEFGRSLSIFHPNPLGNADTGNGSQKRKLGCLDNRCSGKKVQEESL
jgi:hypothetical protein